ncbi:MAG: DNA repair protein RadC [Flavobacteriales bacterium]|nr:DNA repair protein RadC [Flavobacteriales bacterium]MBL6872948.1 DNA repair protein RadC [Flavobacteriales bacterium]
MNHEKLSIKSWSEDDKPREKLVLKGSRTLSHAELLAILIGSGNKKESAVELSKKIMSNCNGKLNLLSKMSLKELMQFNGIGQAKAVTIIAALELAKRKAMENSTEKPSINSSIDAYNQMRYDFEGLDHEQFWILLLNRANKIIESKNISKGGISATVVDPKLIFSSALQEKASGIILFHNHPSGNVSPSKSDIALTTKLKDGGKLLEINIIDHIIIGQNTYFSFADEQML